MKILGFNFDKVNAEKDKSFNKCNIAANVEFINVEKSKLDMLKDAEVANISFKFGVDYNASEGKNTKTLASVSLTGFIVANLTKEESKSLFDSWKKKQIPLEMKTSLLNLVLRRCSLKALTLEEDLNLPSHIPFPRVQFKN